MPAENPPGPGSAGFFMLGAVLLAAGAGQRLGGRPKSLLELDGVPLIRHHVAALAEAGAQQTVVVLGHHAEHIAPALAGLNVRCVHNPRPQDGPVSSQRLGLAALGGPLHAVLMALADQPLVNAADIAALVTAFRQRPADTEVVYPEVQGQRGNPVVFTARVRQQILASAENIGCRQWQAAHPQAVAPWATGNRHYRVDIDTPEDLARFAQDGGPPLRWPAAFRESPGGTSISGPA